MASIRLVILFFVEVPMRFFSVVTPVIREHGSCWRCWVIKPEGRNIVIDVSIEVRDIRDHKTL